MKLVPFQSGDGVDQEFVTENVQPQTPVPQVPEGKKVNSIRKYAMDRQIKLLNVVLKLAQKGYYDDSGAAKFENGEKLDIIPLLLHCFSPGRNIKGLESFVDMLHRAGVDPENIINHNVREMMYHRKRATPSRSNVSAPQTEVTQVDPAPELENDVQATVEEAKDEVITPPPPKRKRTKAPPANKTLSDPTQMTLRNRTKQVANKRKREVDEENTPTSTKFNKGSVDWEGDDSSF